MFGELKINIMFSSSFKQPVYIFAYGDYNSKQVNVSGIQIFRAQFLALHLLKVMLNAATIYQLEIIQTKCKYIYRSFINEKSCRIISKIELSAIEIPGKFPRTAGPALFHLHPQKELTICTFLASLASKAGKEQFPEKLLLSD